MSMPVTMTADEITRARAVFLGDQASAARRARTQVSAMHTARVLVALYLTLGAYAVLAVLGVVPAAGWSPLG